MADQQVTKMVGVRPDAISLADCERVPDGAAMHTHFAAAAERNHAQFLAVTYGDKRVGTAIFTYLPDEDALVCNLLSCTPIEGANLGTDVAVLAEAWGKRLGAHVLRFWTARKGLVRLMETQGFTIKHVGEKAIG